MLPFTRDLDGCEVEIKLSANCTDPTLFVLDLSDEFDRGVYPGWLVQRNLGVRETAITTWRLNIQAWGVKNSESLIQKIMVAERADGMKILSQKETVYPPLWSKTLFLFVQRTNQSRVGWNQMIFLKYGKK